MKEEELSCMGNMFFEKKDIHKCTRVSGLEKRKSLLDLILVQEEDNNNHLDVTLFRSSARPNLGPSLSEGQNKMLEELA